MAELCTCDVTVLLLTSALVLHNTQYAIKLLEPVKFYLFCLMKHCTGLFKVTSTKRVSFD